MSTFRDTARARVAPPRRTGGGNAGDELAPGPEAGATLKQGKGKENRGPGSAKADAPADAAAAAAAPVDTELVKRVRLLPQRGSQPAARAC